ncbi:MAG: hypothetical protein ACTS3F_04875 [Phycisphaerales bacterium]
MMASAKKSVLRAGRVAAAAVAGVGLAALLGGCVADGPQPPDRPTPRRISVPEGVRPAIVQLNASPTAIDTNSNGYADTIMLTAYLFPAAPAPPVPMAGEGTFVFTLEDDSRTTLARWEIPPEEARAALRRFAPGPGYQFELDINSVGDDRIDRTWGNLSADYILEDGSSLPQRGEITIQIGMTGTGPRGR